MAEHFQVEYLIQNSCSFEAPESDESPSGSDSDEMIESYQYTGRVEESQDVLEQINATYDKHVEEADELPDALIIGRKKFVKADAWLRYKEDTTLESVFSNTDIMVVPWDELCVPEKPTQGIINFFE